MSNQERVAIYESKIEYTFDRYTRNDWYNTDNSRIDPTTFETTPSYPRPPSPPLPRGDTKDYRAAPPPNLSAVNKYEDVQKMRQVGQISDEQFKEFDAKVEEWVEVMNRHHDHLLFEAMEKQVRNVLTEDLPKTLREEFDLDVGIKVIGVHPGSMVVFFYATIFALGSTAGVVAQYKDLYESFTLILSQAKRVLDIALNYFSYNSRNTKVTQTDVVLHNVQVFKEPTVADTEADPVLIEQPKDSPIEATSSDNRLFFEMLSELRNLSRNNSVAIASLTQQTSTNRPTRDDFFYFLLILSTVEFVIIAFLVMNALIRTYS